MRDWYQRLSGGLQRTREALTGQINTVLGRGPEVDEDFWEDVEDALICADMGARASAEIVGRLRSDAARLALPDADAVVSHLVSAVAAEMRLDGEDFLDSGPRTVLVVGVNGAGKTTTVGKLAKAAADSGRGVLLGSADTFRAAADEQLAIWSRRAGVEVVRGERGADPASVVFETARRARESGADLVLIDTAGRLHTKTDLMAELAKIRRVAERESPHPVSVLLVMDATTGQNGLAQGRAFHEALGLDGIAITKLDGTAKAGVVVAVVREIGVPVLRIGVGESAEDLRPFDAEDFASALVRGG